MPVIEPGSWVHPGSKPDWSEIGTIGRFAVSVEPEPALRPVRAGGA